MNAKDDIEQLWRRVQQIERQAAGLPVRLGDSGGGGIGNHFQVVRGLTTAAVSPADPAFQIESIAEYEQYSATPSTPLWVKAPDGGVTLSSGQAIWAIYRQNVLTFDPGGGDVQVDWLMFEPGSSPALPPLRRFELTATKTLLQNSATVRWLDDAGAMTGSPLTIYDPAQRFSGRAAGYLSGEPGFVGDALLRTDLGGIEPDRWEIVNMEGFADWAVVELYYAGPPIPLFLLRSFGGGQWTYRAPVLLDTQVNVVVPTDMVSQLVVGRRYYAKLLGPDPVPFYEIVALRTAAQQTGGGLITVYIDHDVPRAVQFGSSFQPGITTVERYELNVDNGRYVRGAAIEIECHDSSEGVPVETGEPLRGFCTQNEYGRHVLHAALCEPIT